MKYLIASAGLAALALASCATPCSDDPQARRQATYACADGSELNVTFDLAAGRALVSEDGGSALDLPVQISGSGFRYADEDVELRGRGAEVLWTSPAGETVTCQATSQTTIRQDGTPVASETPRPSSMACAG